MFSLPKWTLNYRDYFSSLNCLEIMLHTGKLLPLSHFRGSSISALDKKIQVHWRMLHTSYGPASIRLLDAVLSGIAVHSSILCNLSCWKQEALLKPAHLCRLLRACPGAQAVCFTGQFSNTGRGQYGIMALGPAELKGMNWVFYGLSFAFDYSAIQLGTNLPACLVGGGRLFFKISGTSEYKMMSPSQ